MKNIFNLNKLVLADTRGEFWITDSGQSMFADSDISDYSHEAYVMETILNSHDIDTNMGWLEINNEAKEQKEMSPDDFIKDKYGFTNDEINVLRGSEDARTFAMKEWGWKRLQDNNVETWTLTSRDLKAIANGLWDAYQENAETSEFNIFVGMAGKWYSDIPYELISAENPMSIASYQPNQYTGYAGPKSYEAEAIFNLGKFAAKMKGKKKRKYKDERKEGDKIDWQLDFGHPWNRRKDPYKPNKEAQSDKDFANKDEKAIFIIANYFIEHKFIQNNIIPEMSMLEWVGSPRREYAKELCDNFFEGFEKITKIYDGLSEGSLEYFLHDYEKLSAEVAAYRIKNDMKRLKEDVSKSKEYYDKKFYRMASRFLSGQGFPNAPHWFEDIGNMLDKCYLSNSGRQDNILVQEFSQYDIMMKTEKEPHTKYVSPNDSPPKGFAWKKQDEFGGWEWYKENWDSSD